MTLEEALEESWAFQEMKKAYEEGIAKGLQALSLISFIEEYFPSLVQLARDIIGHIKWTLEELQDLFRKAVDAKDEEDVYQLLLNAQKQHPQYICQWRDEIIAIPHGRDEGTTDTKD
jgi:hypothetical protein